MELCLLTFPYSLTKAVVAITYGNGKYGDKIQYIFPSHAPHSPFPTNTLLPRPLFISRFPIPSFYLPYHLLPLLPLTLDPYTFLSSFLSLSFQTSQHSSFFLDSDPKSYTTV